MNSKIKDPNSKSLLKELTELDERDFGDLNFKYIKLHKYLRFIISCLPILFYFRI